MANQHKVLPAGASSAGIHAPYDMIGKHAAALPRGAGVIRTPSMATHSIPAADVHLKVHEQGTGFPLVLLPGMWCDHHDFDTVAHGMAGNYRTVGVDLRGHGGSGVPPQSWTVTDLARDMVRILDFLNIEAAVVVGHSLGGMAALQMALMAPSRLRGLVLLSTSAEAEKPERRAQLSLMSMTINMGGMNRWLARRVASAFFSPSFARRSPAPIRAWRRRLRAMPKRALLQALEAVRDRPSVVDRLGALQMPALVMGTREDPVAEPAQAETLARRIDHARLLMLPGGGHALPMEHSGELVQALHQFMNDQVR